jgi:hypothetical protein
MKILEWLYDLIFGCRHPHAARSRVWTEHDNDGTAHDYQTCLDCGKRLEYSLIRFRQQEEQA